MRRAGLPSGLPPPGIGGPGGEEAVHPPPAREEENPMSVQPSAAPPASWSLTTTSTSASCWICPRVLVADDDKHLRFLAHAAETLAILEKELQRLYPALARLTPKSVLLEEGAQVGLP